MASDDERQRQARQIQGRLMGKRKGVAAGSAGRCRRLLPVVLDDEFIQQVVRDMPELPEAKQRWQMILWNEIIGHAAPSEPVRRRRQFLDQLSELKQPPQGVQHAPDADDVELVRELLSMGTHNARTESEKDGKIVDKVVSVTLQATDFSRMK